MKTVIRDLDTYRERAKLVGNTEIGFPSSTHTKILFRYLVEDFIELFAGALAHQSSDHDFLRIRILMEEALNRCALKPDSFNAFVDRSITLAFALLNTLREFGVPLEEAWPVVVHKIHATNGVGGVTKEGQLLLRNLEISPHIGELLERVRKERAASVAAEEAAQLAETPLGTKPRKK